MRISFHHANPAAGNESFLLRFEAGDGETACVLVDAGNGVDVDALLEPDDSLAAICLTHAHLDHYAELAAAHRDDTPILTSPATASVLADVFDVASDEYDVRATDAMADAVTPIDDWTTVAPGVDVHPIPAGHVPGGVGFVVRATDGEETHRVLATGDFTSRRAGGYPGFDATNVPDVDALFLTASTNDTFESSLTDALGTALERAHGGARTLVATSGLFGAQCAYLLAALVEEYDLGIPVRVVGQVAKHHDALDYDDSVVEQIPVFEDPRECLGPGTITIAGPEIPRERSSGRLFDVLREDASACVVQLVGSGKNPLTGGRCTVHDYECVNHPTRETLAAVHDAVDPTETVVVHQHGGAKGAFNDLDSVVWGAGDVDEYTLYDGQSWRLPPWMGGRTISRGGGQSLQQFADPDLLDSMALPAVERHADPDLEAEGIDTDEIDRYLHRDADAGASPDVPDSLTDESSTTDADSETVSDPMTTNHTDQDREESSPSAPAGLIDTTHGDLDDAVDPGMRELLEETDCTPQEFMDALRVHRRRQANRGQPTEEAEAEEAGAAEEAEAEEAEAAESEELPEADAATSSDEAEVDAGGSGEGSASASTPPTAGSPPDRDAPDDAEPTEDAGSTAPADHTTDGAEALDVSVNPLAVALAERAIERGSAGVEPSASVGELVTDAVTDYSLALLSGEAAGDESERVSVGVTASPGIEQLLGDVVTDADRFDSTDALAAEGIAALLTGDADQSIEVQDAASVHGHLDAVVRNDGFVFEDRGAVVDAAIVWHVPTQ